MPINYKDYNPGFKVSVARLKAERGDKCELCFAENKIHVARYPEGLYPWLPCQKDHPRATKIIITTHHINGDKKDDGDENVILLCQRCHLRLDAAKHRRKAKATRDRKKGQETLKI